MNRKFCLWISVAFGLCLLCASPALSATYTVDTVYDDINGSWDDEIPTLYIGNNYNITVEGYGDVLARSTVEMGISIDPENDSVYDEIIMSGFSTDNNKNYSYTQNVPVPWDADPGILPAMAWIYADPVIQDIVPTFNNKEYQMNIAANAVPEPMSLTLMLGGLLGIAGIRRRRA